MKKILRLTESDLVNLVKKVLHEQKWGDVVKPVLCKDIGITDGHKWCNEKTKTKIIEIDCGAIGVTDPNSRGKFGGKAFVKGRCSGKDGLPMKSN